MASHLEELIAKAKQKVDSKNRAKTAKLPDGRSKWRILPPTSPTADFYQDFGQHFIKGSDGKVSAVYVCVDKTYGKPCAVCGAITHAISSVRDDEMVKIIKESNAGARVLFNAVQVDGPNQDAQILEVPPTVFNEYVRLLSEWGAEIMSLDSGRDIIIERTGKGIGTKYSVQVAAKATAMPKNVMDKAVDLAEYVKQESEDGKNRALQNLNAVAGLLAAPSASGSTAGASMSMKDVMLEDEDPTRDIPLTGTATRVVEEPAVVVEPVKAAAATAPVASGDSELDDLIASLG